MGYTELGPEILQYQIASAVWANQRVLAAAQDLSPEELAHDFKSSEHSILGSLAHVYRAERVWLARIHQQTLPFKVEGDDTLASLSENWPRLGQQWVEWSKTLTSATSQAELMYQDLKGNKWSHPIWKVVLHVVNHSTHHRGQAIGFMRALGHVPPSVDSIFFARESSS